MNKTFQAIPTALALAAALLMAPVAHAGRSCEQRPLTPRTLTQGLALAQLTAQALDAEFARSGARVVVLGRAGQDLGKYQLRYSHLGWAYKSAEGPWRVLHKLNQCGTSTGSIYRQGLGEFFLDDLWRHEAVWSVPAPALQAPLLALLTDPARSLRLHQRDYNMVAYAWGTRYQQSNQWALETMTMAAETGVASRAQAQAWLGFKGYQPSTLRLGALTRLGASASSAHIRFDDHPNAKRFSDRIETVTVDSVLDWLARTGLGSAPQRIAL
ncbi:DUF2145 domain-containing protein [Hydrogenophaga taeniospiralis]|jgi:hypothetical protein|uniref:DUF2145 domain-containing protein n=1 Tax=Hydrogenophaga taeniospiralis TaxID=65656 RepID=UPI001CFC1464|nr:DUF2145 domain-containing protein [Hydrogenophaga taeniospiralis]UCU94881.1 DUF2145 domain-containing protein [Hydrogenophaga taeniospiralis]